MLNLSSSKVHLRLKADPTDRTITAYYQIDGGAMILLQTFVAPPEFFSFDAAGIDPTIGTRSFGGIFATHRNGPTPLAYTFRRFLGRRPQRVQPPPSGRTSASTRSSFPVSKPDLDGLGPRRPALRDRDVRQDPRAHPQREQAGDHRQVITTLGSRLTLGITVDPRLDARATSSCGSRTRAPPSNNGS